MCKRALLAMLWFSLIVFDASDASFVSELRKLVAMNPKDDKVTASSAINGSPSPTPVPGDNKTDPKPHGETHKKRVDSKGSGNAVSPAPSPLAKGGDEKVSQNASNNASPASSPSPKRDGEMKSHEEEKNKSQGKDGSQSDTNESCEGLNTCTDQGDMIACISETGSKYLVILIQNGGDSTIKVKLFKDSNLEDIEVAKHQTKKVNIPLISSESTQLTLNAGKGECVLHMGTKGNIFVHLPSYDKILTPVNGAYFLIFTVLVFGGTWACCKLRKKRHDGVPYQELEMALPESVSAIDVETAERWDQVWDDDWDENVAVKSPAALHSGNISANGLTSRSSNKDGWEDNWDDSLSTAKYTWERILTSKVEMEEKAKRSSRVGGKSEGGM